MGLATILLVLLAPASILSTNPGPLAAELLWEMTQLYPEKNVVVSPFSLYLPLTLLALGSTGMTQEELLSVMGASSKFDLLTSILKTQHDLNNVKTVTVSTTARIYINRGYEATDDINNYSKELFSTNIEEVDFSQRQYAAQKINEWVSANTEGRIHNLVQPDMFDSMTAIVLVNAIFFQARWQSRFINIHTADRVFYESPERITLISTMNQQGLFKYGESTYLDAKFVKLDFTEDNFYMLFVVPNQIDGVDDLVRKVNDLDLDVGVDNMTMKYLDLYVPKFMFETTTDLKEVLSKMSLRRLFDPADAHLENMVKSGGENLFISKAVQKSFIVIDEHGIEAVSSNALITRITLAAPPPDYCIPAPFRVDRPFMYIVMGARVPLFVGVYRTQAK